MRVRYLGHAIQRVDNGKHCSDLACNRERLMSEHCSALQIALLPDDISQIDQWRGHYSLVAERSLYLQAFLKQQSSRREIALHAHCFAQIAERQGDGPLIVSRALQRKTFLEERFRLRIALLAKLHNGQIIQESRQSTSHHLAHATGQGTLQTGRLLAHTHPARSRSCPGY